MKNLGSLLSILEVIIVVLIGVAYITLAERKVMGSMQRRVGPNIIGFFGILQPIIDGVKAAVKETIIPQQSNKLYFIIGPIIVLTLCLIIWAPIPFKLGECAEENNYGVLYILAISSLSVYILLYSGWSSNSKYAFLGSLRSTSQMISYEVSIGFIVVAVVLSAGSFNLTEIVFAQKYIWFFIPLFPMFLMFCISALAETNRHPFDLPEAEAELVSGYNVEYSGMGFALFFLGEYANMLLMSSIISLLFLGGWLPVFNFPPFNMLPDTFWLAFKICIFVFLFCWVRAALPRYRYDQLMNLGWRVFLPLSLTYLVFTASALIAFNFLV